MRKTLKIFAVVIVVILSATFLFGPGIAERSLNHRLNQPPYPATAQAKKLHRQLWIADLHADSLLWDRDLLQRSDYGLVDVPRLVEGNIALQAFTVVTKIPRTMNLYSNDSAGSDLITLLSIVQLRPFRTWSSLKERALFQAQKLQDCAARSQGSFCLIRSRQDLNDYVERRKQNQQMTAGFLGLEGAQALEGNLGNLDMFYRAGYRMIAPTHFFDTEIGGSAHGTRKGGLTELGKEWVQRMEAKHMIIDVAHASTDTIRDVLATATKPVIDSHTGVKGTCDNIRNLSDEEVKGIARTGGIIGIGYWETAVCKCDAKSIARAIRYTANLVGPDHAALGSDFDGAVTAPFDTTGVIEITDALLAEGFSEDDIRLIMGGNVLRLLQSTLAPN